jgi:hypothetical protein
MIGYLASSPKQISPQRFPLNCVPRQSNLNVCRKYGISEYTFYRWKRKYGGLDVSQARRLKVLEMENARLKKLVAEQAPPPPELPSAGILQGAAEIMWGMRRIFTPGSRSTITSSSGAAGLISSRAPTFGKRPAPTGTWTGRLCK